MAAQGRTFRPQPWQALLGAGGVLALLFGFVPPFRGNGLLMNLLGVSALIAVLAGIRLHRPASSAPWGFFALGLTLFWLGDLYTYSYPHLLGAEVPFPSPGDALYVAMYPVMMAGLLLLVRRAIAPPAPQIIENDRGPSGFPVVQDDPEARA